MQSLAEFLGTGQPLADPEPRLEDITDAKQFADAVLRSREFRIYIVNSLALGSLPAAITTRLMDYAWGKPVERVEHSGRVDSVTEVRRVVIHVSEQPTEAEAKYTTH